MLAKKIKCTDYNGETREETCYFNVTESELVLMQFGELGGLDEAMMKMVETQDTPKMMQMIKDFILSSYGEKSPDGKYFKKSKEISDNFACTEAFNVLFMELVSDDKKASEFINAVLPVKVREEMKKHEADVKAEFNKLTSNSSIEEMK